MITKRDKQILRWVEKYKSITIYQCSTIFFNNNKMAYDQARKRLRYLNQEGLLKRFRKDPRSETVYYIDRKLRIHDLKIMDMIAYLYELNLTNIYTQNDIHINENLTYIIDTTVDIDYKYPIMVEVDYTHYTNWRKIRQLIYYLENKHKELSYTFLIVRETFYEIKAKNVGKQSRVIFVPWDFNKDSKLIRSLCSLLEIEKAG